MYISIFRFKINIFANFRTFLASLLLLNNQLAAALGPSPEVLCLCDVLPTGFHV